MAWNVIRAIGMTIALGLTIGILVKSSFDNINVFNKMLEYQHEKNVNENELFQYFDFQSLYLKIFVNYSQNIAIIGQYSLDLPSFITNIFSFLSFCTAISTKFMAFECLFENFSFGDSIFLRVTCLYLLSLILLISSIVIWKIYQRIKKVPQVFDKIYATMLGIFIMLQPSVLNENIKILNCMRIDGHRFLRIKPDYSCESDIYKWTSIFYIWPAFILWAFIIPLIILSFLIRNRKKLYEIEVFKRFNFFYIGYKSRYYYWDVLILLKNSCVNLVSLSTQDEPIVILLFVMIIVFFYTKYLMQCNPFITRSLNFLENFACFIALLILILSSCDKFIDDDNAKMGITVIVVLLNSSFYSLWAFTFISYLSKKYRNVFKKYCPLILEKLKKIQHALSLISKKHLMFGEHGKDSLSSFSSPTSLRQKHYFGKQEL